MADNYKKIINNRNNTVFSLYGSRMKEIEFHNKTLKLKDCIEPDEDFRQ